MIKYYMKPDSNTPPAYCYCVGEDTDSLWNAETCIEVDLQPSINHVYDFDAEEWIISELFYMMDLRSKRDVALDNSDKYTLSDYPISEEDKALIVTYRQALRDCPSHENLEDRILPECPEV